MRMSLSKDQKREFCHSKKIYSPKPVRSLAFHALHCVERRVFPHTKTRTAFGFRRTALRRKLTTLFKVVFSNVALKRPEFKRAIHFLVESVASNMRRTEPVFVAINWDEMWIGVKGLSSLGLAGSPRKVCWH